MSLTGLSVPDADKLKIKSGLVIEITKAMRKLGLTQKAAAGRMGMVFAQAVRENQNV